jgi:hypothetical protein
MQPANLEELADNGVILELNRTFLHPLGLSDTVKPDSNGVNRLVIIQSDDPSGISYREDSIDQMHEVVVEKLSAFQDLAGKCHSNRQDKLGYVVQPLAT